MAKILVVDDERMLVETIAHNLEKEGYEVVTAFDGDHALERARDDKPDLIVLDLMLPKVSGQEVCRQLRNVPKYRKDTLILMLTARAEEDDRVRGLELGADDYMVKPFGMRELVARVRALLRRGATGDAASRESLLRAGHIEIDTRSREVHLAAAAGPAREVRLSAKEFDLLRVLIKYQGQALPRLRLLQEVWGSDFVGDERTLDVHIRWLREKLEAEPSQPRHILTVRGVGYKIRA